MKTLAVLLSAISLSSAAPAIRATCDKATLEAAANAYINSQTAGSITSLQSFFASNWTYVENNKQIDHTKGVVHKALKIDHRRTNYDLVECATYTEYIATTGPYVIGTQIRHDAEGKVNKIDVIASTTNSWIFNATKTLEYVKGEKWDPIPEAKWDSREAIKAAGDAYMDMWSSATSHEKVPWGTPCTRLEGSAYTGTVS
jgi:hypothetical protein